MKRSLLQKNLLHLQNEEIITAKKLVALAKTITDGKGNPITIPFFAILGNSQ
jgi:hypothetical protein